MSEEMVDQSYLLKDGDKLTQYRYKLTEFYVIMDGEPEPFPIERVANMSIGYYYEDAVFPIFKLGVTMEPSRYYQLLKNRDKVKFKVRVQMYYDANDTHDDPSMLRDFINDVFVFFPADDDYDPDTNIRQESDINQLDNLNNYIEIFLFKEVVKKLRSTVNYVFTGTTLSTVVSYLLNKAGVNKVLMSPFENTQTHGQIICPPQSIEAQIRYLNNTYGFHKKGSMLFFGFFHTYLLNCKEGCTAWKKDEWKETKIYILDKSNTKSSLDGPFLRPDDETYHILIRADAISLQTASVVDNVIGGIDPTIINMAGSSTNNGKVEIKGLENHNKKIMFNDSSNPYMMETQVALQKANSKIITASLYNVNLEAITPNKKISIIFEDTKKNTEFGGVYRIASAVHSFQNATGDFTIHSIIVFKRL